MEQSFIRTIDADIHAIPVITAELDHALRARAFTEEEILDTQLAVEEAITNVIMHGYAGQHGEIVITCRTTSGLVEVQIEDCAPPFDPLSLPEPDMSGDIEERKTGGLGVFLIRQVMDDIIYRHEAGKNILVLVKKKTG